MLYVWLLGDNKHKRETMHFAMGKVTRFTASELAV
jgi:hypothetical protein